MLPIRIFGPPRCLIPTPVLTSKYPIYAVCVCVSTPHTVKPPSLWCRCCRNHSEEGVGCMQPNE